MNRECNRQASQLSTIGFKLLANIGSVSMLPFLVSFIIYWLLFCSYPEVLQGQNTSSLPNSNLTSGQVRCANESFCDPMCHITSKKIKQDYSRGWAVRHHSIGAYYSRLNCTIAVEIGIARAELTTYLLRHVPSIHEYHGMLILSMLCSPFLLLSLSSYTC